MFSGSEIDNRKDILKKKHNFITSFQESIKEA